MRILNTKDYNKHSGKFSLPGFRTGSLIKRIIACFYYVLVLVFAVNSIRLTVSGDFGNSMDVFLAIVVELLIVMILVAPVIIVGFSNHFDWHGIKLFLIIMVSWCVLFTAAQFVSTLFSEEFINSTNSYNETHSEQSAQSSGENVNLEIDEGIIKDNIDEINNSASSSKE